MKDINDFDKYVYNTYLRVVGQVQGRPYRYRKNFDTLDDEIFIELKKLSSFLSSQTDIVVEDFIIAPYEVYGKSFRGLSYYNSSNAISAYKRFAQIKQPFVIDKRILKQSLAFVLSYCKEEKISKQEYLTHTNKDGILIILLHLVTFRINFFTLHTLDFLNNFNKFNREWLKKYINDFDDIFDKSLIVFSDSQKRVKDKK